MFTTYTWQGIVDHLVAQPEGTIARIPVSQIPHPSGSGMSLGLGLPLGQRATFTASLSNTQILYVEDFDTHYEARLISRAPEGTLGWTMSQRLSQPVRAKVPLEQAIREAPGTTMLATTALGALLGALSGTRQSTLTGALLGGIFGLTAVSVASAESSPATSQRAQELVDALANLKLAPAVPRLPVANVEPAESALARMARTAKLLSMASGPSESRMIEAPEVSKVWPKPTSAPAGKGKAREVPTPGTDGAKADPCEGAVPKPQKERPTRVADGKQRRAARPKGKPTARRTAVSSGKNNDDATPRKRRRISG